MAVRQLYFRRDDLARNLPFTIGTFLETDLSPVWSVSQFPSSPIIMRIQPEAVGILPIFGTSGIGKGAFIEECVRLRTGQNINISSSQFRSHTTKHQFIPCGALAFLDTAGSNDRNHMDGEAMVKLLSESKDSLFYPPIFILLKLDG
jgi:hypothetical protein